MKAQAGRKSPVTWAFMVRREWDLNPRNPEAQRFSRPSDSAALASLREGSLGLRR